MANIDTPQLSYPFEFRPDGLVRQVEQDDLNEIAMAVEIAIRFPLGSREDVPGFGMPDLTFRESPEEIAGILLSHILQWEPRARLLVDHRPDLWDQMVHTYILTVEGTARA
jgi:phage baseplate assembly protein W